MTDLTAFAPNTPAALEMFTTVTANMTQTELSALFKYHLVGASVAFSADLKDGMKLKTLQGKDLTITVASDGSKYVNGAKIITSDYLVANGVLHVVDSILDQNNITTPIFPATTPTASLLAEPLAAGAKAGIAVGVLALRGVIAAGVFFKRRKPNLDSNNSNEPDQVLVQPNDKGKWDWEQQSKSGSATQLNGQGFVLQQLSQDWATGTPATTNESYIVELESARARSPPLLQKSSQVYGDSGMVD